MQNYDNQKNGLFKIEPFAFLFDLHKKAWIIYCPRSIFAIYSVGVTPKCFLKTVEK